MRTRVKFCGITRPEDAVAAARAGADAIGLVFYPPSPRHVTAERAAVIVRDVPPFVSVVGLFVDADEREINAVLDAVRIDVLQFHGDEPAAACRGYARPYLKAVRMRDNVDLTTCAAQYADASGLLLDAWHDVLPGGTGKTFDWSTVPANIAKPLILAGGLTADNVAQAIVSVRPYAVDVSGGIESAPGIKDAAKMRAFMRSVESVKTD
ncbi:MAG: phosphoribosylanthranilate isomerase [Gammaproteobacteria bacterium]|nr:MAG: phosphoribosylanthranilate isomerase [Gammaproteobacteria bacterium]TND07398.1 MAG: phosphoribosylanthranilate isomerase [Gammaproteobacteria bacterium]